MVASLNGLDVLVFTAGVGENSSIVREKTCEGLAYLGLQLDLAKNEASPVDENIATLHSPSTSVGDSHSRRLGDRRKRALCDRGSNAITIILFLIN